MYFSEDAPCGSRIRNLEALDIHVPCIHVDSDLWESMESDFKGVCQDVFMFPELSLPPLMT